MMKKDAAFESTAMTSNSATDEREQLDLMDKAPNIMKAYSLYYEERDVRNPNCVPWKFDKQSEVTPLDNVPWPSTNLSSDCPCNLI